MKSQVTIRPAELEDLKACLALDHSYYTDHVWQMDVQEENTLAAVTFRKTRLPRPVCVHYPRDREALLTDWHRRDCFLVATLSAEGRPIVGYLTMTAHEGSGVGWVADLVVTPRRRRKGIATQLLRAGKTWGRKAGLDRLIIETQTKNHPAICFLERQRFSFCGFNDRFYANQDIALFFALDL